MAYARRRVAVFLAAAVGLAGLWGVVLVGSARAALPAGCSQSGSTVTCTFGYTGAAGTWTPPAGITSATFDLFGAQGGGGNVLDLGGLGGETSATLAVVPGQAIEIVVGGGGISPNRTGGFNGGGAGGSAAGNGPAAVGPGGGGASDVRAGACAATAGCGLGDRVLVAGGGGGNIGFGRGSGGGYPSGAHGVSNAGGGGGGGSQTAGGAAGAADAECDSGVDGRIGVLGEGGAGGGPGTLGGGGGGGGYFGGGGGGASCSSLPSGGGGGGSSFGPAGATFTNATHHGDGLVTITYTTVGAPPPPPTSKAQCKHGGWRSFDGLFKNQGSCLRFVERQHRKHEDRKHQPRSGHARGL